MAVAEKEASQGAANQKPITTHGIQTRASGGIHGIHSAVPTRKKKKRTKQKPGINAPMCGGRKQFISP
jgi:hypothetical protein